MKTNKWIYRIATIVLFIILMVTGVADLLLPEEMVKNISRLGIPEYLMPFLGVLKIIGAIVILFFKNLHLKVGAYAGVLFYSLGIVYIHLAFGHSFNITGIIFTMINLISYFFWMKLNAFQMKT